MFKSGKLIDGKLYVTSRCSRGYISLLLAAYITHAENETH